MPEQRIGSCSPPPPDCAELVHEETVMTPSELLHKLEEEWGARADGQSLELALVRGTMAEVRRALLDTFDREWRCGCSSRCTHAEDLTRGDLVKALDRICPE